MYATIKTKSNYRNLNGQQLEIVKFEGEFIAAKFTDESGVEVTTSFNISEITALREFKR
jgi:hypothetical protein